MNEKEKKKLLKEAAEIARENMEYKDKNRGKISCLFIVVSISLAGMFASTFLISWLNKFLNS